MLIGSLQRRNIGGRVLRQNIGNLLLQTGCRLLGLPGSRIQLTQLALGCCQLRLHCCPIVPQFCPTGVQFRLGLPQLRLAGLQIGRGLFQLRLRLGFGFLKLRQTIGIFGLALFQLRPTIVQFLPRVCQFRIAVGIGNQLGQFPFSVFQLGTGVGQLRGGIGQLRFRVCQLLLHLGFFVLVLLQAVFIFCTGVGQLRLRIGHQFLLPHAAAQLQSLRQRLLPAVHGVLVCRTEGRLVTLQLPQTARYSSRYHSRRQAGTEMPLHCRCPAP